MPKTTWPDVAKKLETCLADISTWMSANMLKLNEEKTELIIFNPKHQVRMTEELRLQALQGTAPQYLEELVVPYQPTRSLRSESGAFLAVPATHGVTYVKDNKVKISQLRRVNQSPHDGTVARRASNPRPFGYEFYALTNCAITARLVSFR
ncbi:hypothetical protein LSH36_144g05035 [Paralvinella palmiformis]|uniref:Uncharacterized protein n=1 Tax=Paralvinella palmiformis TaxID=53620 RepID=A0AAD9JVQ0_9ANNE|nr:hypothetical protein LSH36_144g05035 [Paralvinella palmiformis]